jgi:hypothetical protein
VDPVRELTRAREIQARHKFRADENVIILEYDGRTAFLPVAQMADFDLAALAAGGEPRLLAFKGEAALTSAMLGLVDPEKKKVYFLQGHGEPGMGADSPLSVFRDYITRQNVTTGQLNPAALDAIPGDAAAVFLVAPTTDLEERTARLLEDYWKNDGKLLILLEPTALTPRLDELCARTGLRPRKDRVLRTVRLGFATGILKEVTAEFSLDSQITKRLAGMTLFLPGQTRSIALEPSDGVTLKPLLQPLEEFWGETDFVADEQTGVRYDEGRDAGQPLFVGATAAEGGLSDDRVQVETGKLVLVGNAGFALDAAISSQGLDFLVSATHWLLERGHLAGVTPKPARYFALNLSDRQLGLLSSLVLVAMPAAAALMAILVALRRRA